MWVRKRSFYMVNGQMLTGPHPAESLWELLIPKAVPAHDCGTRRNRALGPCRISSSLFTKVPPIIFFHTAFQAESDKRKNTICHKTDFGHRLRKKILKTISLLYL